MEYEIILGNKRIECEMRNGMYYAEGVTEKDFDVRKAIIRHGELEKSIPYPKAEIDGNYFTLRPKTMEERAARSKKNQMDYSNQWIKENYDRVSVTLPKGTKERISALGYTTSAFINEAVKVLLEANES